MVNATQMAKTFGKSARGWLRNQQTEEFINELATLRNCNPTDLVVISNGGTNPGTWFHEDVALEFARWLSPKFAIWCNDKIKELLTQGQAQVDAMFTPENMLLISKALLQTNAQLESAQKQIAAANEIISEQKAEINDKQQMIDAAVVEIQQRDTQIEKLQPFAEYAEQTLQSKTDHTFTQVAKDLGFKSVYEFQDWAKAKGIIYKQGERWLPMANWSGRGWFASRTFNYLTKNNEVAARTTTTVTERGRAALHYFLVNSRRPSEAELEKGGEL